MSNLISQLLSSHRQNLDLYKNRQAIVESNNWVYNELDEFWTENWSKFGFYVGKTENFLKGNFQILLKICLKLKIAENWRKLFKYFKILPEKT